LSYYNHRFAFVQKKKKKIIQPAKARQPSDRQQFAGRRYFNLTY
jgi:hypothetical protein